MRERSKTARGLVVALAVCACGGDDSVGGQSSQQGSQSDRNLALSAGSIFIVPADTFAPTEGGFALMEFGEQVRDKALFRLSAQTYETRTAAAVAARSGMTGLFSDYAIALDAVQVARMQANGGDLIPGVYGPHRR